MKLRIFIYRPCDSIREPLIQHIESRGHEAAAINFPQTCLQYHSPNNNCSTTKTCADVVIVGNDISPQEGLSMIEKRVKASCGGVKHNAIICISLSVTDRKRMKKIGCKNFKLPLDLANVDEWLAEVEKSVYQQRELSPFTIGGTAA